MLFLETTGYNYSQRRCEEVVMWFVAKYLPRHKLDITVNHRGLLREVFMDGVLLLILILVLESLRLRYTTN